MTPDQPTFGRYRIDGELGRGGMGVVHLATDTRLNRQVALKVISAAYAADPAFVAGFLHEVEVLARLDSPHVISILDSGEVDGRPYLASQYVPGGDLGQALTRHGSLPPDVAVDVCAQVAEALQDAHRAGIVHGDVKPSNILVRGLESARRHAYLCDFGVATSDRSPVTDPDAVAGSWGYLAPERVNGGPATPASDVYALGCVLWACLHGGQPPYTGPDHAVGRAHLSAPIPRLAGDGAQVAHLNSVLAAALAKDPRERHQSAWHLRQHLLGTAPAPASRASESAPKGRRRRWLIPVMALAVVASGALAYAAWRAASGKDPSPAPAPDRAIVGDADGDGLGDLAVMQPGEDGHQLTAYATGTNLSSQWTATGRSTAAGDLDGDGVGEYYSLSVKDGVVGLTAIGDDADDAYDREWSLDLGNQSLVTGDLGDFDGDGDQDLLLWANRAQERGASSLWLARNDDGLTEPSRVQDLGWGSVQHALLAGDFDGDGTTDLANVTTPKVQTESSVELWRWDGSQFAPSGESVAMSEWEGRTTAVDMDGDGTDELVSLYVASSGGHQLLRRGVEGDTFSTSTLVWRSQAGTPMLWGWTLLASDLDGDGLTDLTWMDNPSDNARTLWWARSNGEMFEDPEEVGSAPCPPSNCDYVPWLVG